MDTFAQRLKSARIMNGYSLQELADLIDNRISRQALNKYEHGDFQPDSEMISFLADALKVRPDYFFKEMTIELGEIAFRKLEKFPVKEKNKLIEQVKENLERYIELEEIVNAQTPFVNPIQDLVIENSVDAENAAKQLRIRWKLGEDPIFNAIELLEDNGIKVITVSVEDGFDGLQTKVQNEYPVIVLNKRPDYPLDRLRFTAIHELAHLLLIIIGKTDKESEKLCHRFAAAFLLPETVIRKELGDNRSRLFINEIGPIKQQYGISISAIAYRAKDLGIISESYFRQFMFYISQMGYRIHEPFDYQGYEQSNRFQQLLYRALAEDYISMSKAASLNKQSLYEFRQKLNQV